MVPDFCAPAPSLANERKVHDNSRGCSSGCAVLSNLCEMAGRRAEALEGDSTEGADEAPRRGRGRPPIISEAAVIDAALRVTERVGLDQLTMRLLSEELGMSMMAAYNYVPNKDALVELVAQEVLARIEVPTRSVGSWDVRLLQLSRDIRDHLGQYPGLYDALETVQPTDASEHLVSGVMQILTDAGFVGDDARDMFVTNYTFMLGQLRIDNFQSPLEPPDVMNEVFERGFEMLIQGMRWRLREIRRRAKAPSTPARKKS